MKFLKVFLQTLKVFILFTGCTILFYYAIMWVSEEYENNHKYDEPKGRAIKVVSNSIDKEYDWYERLLLFYLDGE